MKTTTLISTLAGGAILAIGATTAGAQNNSAIQEIHPAEEGQLTEAQLDSIEAVAFGNARNLEEFVITADTPMIKASANQITYNVSEDPASAGSSVLDMLRKMPLVTVDGQDNIQVKGDSNYKIYVNGKPEPMFSQNASVILKSMPAEAVASIELMTDPGAKYDAEGTGTIINLVTDHKQTKNGYNGTASLSVDNRQVFGGVNASAKINKVNLNGGVNVGIGFPGSNKSLFDDHTEYTGDPDNHLLIGSGSNSQRTDYIGANFGASWDMTDNDLISVSADYYKVWGEMKTTDNRSEMFNFKGESQWSYERNSLLKLDIEGVTATAGYQHEFNRKDNYLGINYQFSFNKFGLPIDYTYGAMTNFFPQYIFESSTNSNYTREHTVQIDYSNQLNEHAKIETGAKTLFRRNSAHGSTRGSNNGLDYSPIESLESDMNQPQDIYAVYGLYTATYGNFSGSAGLRYEHTLMGIRYPGEHDKDFTTHLNDVVPNANVTYNFSPARNLTATYSMRISRPSIQQLNPVRLQVSDTRIQEGNPNLRSERINRVGVSYNDFGRTIGGGVSLDYTNSSNAIAATSYLDGYRIVSTYDNIGRRQETALNIFLMWNPSQTVNISLNGGARYTDLKAFSTHANGDHPFANHGFSGNVNANINWQLPAKFNFSAYGGWNSGNVELMSNSGNFSYYGLSIMRPFLKDDALKITLSASNCFQKYLTFTTTSFGEGFRADNRWRNESWNVGISFSWNFGKSTSGVRQVNSSIINDDLSTAKSSTGGIGGN